MKFPYSMLQDFVVTDLTAEECGDLLTMAGFELESIDWVEGVPVLDVKVMSNRGDGLSMLGLAREVLAKDRTSKPTELYERSSQNFNVPSTTSLTSSFVEIETEDCNRYACRIFRGLSHQPTPDWIKDRLRKAGQRSISFLVDLTNYVMLELGQPLHAYDLNKLAGNRIVVRKAQPGETLTTLDGRLHSLREDQMMICDAEKPVGAAGIMGGEHSEVSAETTDILLESAHFDSRSIRRTRKQLGLNTDASYRFERSVDPEVTVAAIARFTELIGLEGEPIVDLYPGKVSRFPVRIRVDRARTLLGMSMKEDEAQRYLERLGMEVAGHGDPFYVVPPSWRPDIKREEDLIEELGRVHGYEKIPERLPAGTTPLGIPRGPLQQVDQVRESTIREGYIQVMCHTLSSRHPFDLEGPRVGPRVVASPEYAFLRNSLLPGLSEVLRRNGGKNIHIFEIGKVFEVMDSGVTESRNLALLSSGELTPSFRRGETVPLADFFSLKGHLEQIFAAIGKKLFFGTADRTDPRTHPTRQALVSVEGEVVGLCGQIHPDLASALKIDPATLMAELNLDKILSSELTPLQIYPISKNPSVRRDVALLVDKSIPFSQIEHVLTSAAGPYLEKYWVFDDFAGAGIPETKHSLGIAMQLRKMGENFTDSEANQVRDEVAEALAALGGSLR